MLNYAPSTGFPSLGNYIGNVHGFDGEGKHLNVNVHPEWAVRPHQLFSG
jgi:hypothetical protein